jgi:hypothetical protein
MSGLEHSAWRSETNSIPSLIKLPMDKLETAGPFLAGPLKPRPASLESEPACQPTREFRKMVERRRRETRKPATISTMFGSALVYQSLKVFGGGENWKPWSASRCPKMAERWAVNESYRAADRPEGMRRDLLALRRGQMKHSGKRPARSGSVVSRASAAEKHFETQRPPLWLARHPKSAR